PNLDENPHLEAYKKGIKPGAASAKVSPSKSMDQMLEEANITPANLRKLSDNFQRFGQTVDQIKDMSEVTSSTTAYSNSAREAAEALGQMKTTFVGASKTMSAFNEAAEDTAKFH